MSKDTFYLVVTGIVGILLFITMKNGGFDMNSPKNVLQKVKKKYGTKIADWVERIYRLETNHFTSGQYKGTYSAGMEAHGEKFPYGWTTPNKLWKVVPEYAPVSVINFRENATGKMKPFLAFRNLEGGMMSLAHYLAEYNNPGRWYSTNELDQDGYIQKLSQIQTQWT